MAARVQSVDRVFALLECLADGGGSLSLSELAAQTKLPMPTIHRLVQSLVSRGYVRQEASKRYALGSRMIRLGEAAGRMLGSWARPYLAGLVDRWGETANMAMLEQDACSYVAQVPSPRSVRMFAEAGRQVLPHCTGVGKAILATLPDHEVRALLARTGMPALTPHTLTTPEAIQHALDAVRRQGYAVDDGEQELGVRCVAVPVRGLPFRAAISVSGPDSRVTLDDVTRIASDLQAVADQLRTAFGT